MKAGKLRDTIAHAMLVKPNFTWVAMRNLREKGLLTSGARGVNAPRQTYLDAARVLISQTMDPNPGRSAPYFVKTFGFLPRSNPDFAWLSAEFTIENLIGANSADTLENAVAALIQIFAEHNDSPAFQKAGLLQHDGSFQKPICQVSIFEHDEAAQIQMDGAIYHFDNGFTSVSEYTLQGDERFRLGRQAICFINQEVIDVVAAGFREGR